MEILNIAGAVMTLVMGCLGLFFPQRAAAFTGLRAVTPAGRSEFRSTFGGLFLLAGLAALVTRQPAAFLTLCAAWAGAASGRLLSILADRAHDPRNWAGVLFEAGFAALRLAGAPTALLR